MSTKLPEGMPRISPYLFYKDLPSALDWLSKAFGFEKKMTVPGPDGACMHAEMNVKEAVIMMGPASTEQGTLSPQDLPGINQSLYVYVDDVDAHCSCARLSGAEITTEPVEMFWGDRMYSARDCEGHHWTFATQVKIVATEDLKPPGA